MTIDTRVADAISALIRWGLGSARDYNVGLSECQRLADELRAASHSSYAPER